MFEVTHLKKLFKTEERQEDGTVVRCDSPSQYIKLNVGGSLFYTTIATLTKYETMLQAMFSGRMEVLADADGWVLIDRSGRNFHRILQFLRDDLIDLPESKKELIDFLIEAKYFCVRKLIDECTSALENQNREAVMPVCRIRLIRSNAEADSLINTCRMPIVKLHMNKHNNKYSYTSASDENLWKNVELFEMLSLRFNSRLVFLKNVGPAEICCWSFYANGRKIGEVGCSSIVYATDKKQTKVDWPIARIYEEMLKCFLYEDGREPDPELMQATCLRGVVAGGVISYTSDEEEERLCISRLKMIL